MRYIDADLIEYEPMCRARGNGMYEDCEIAYKDQIDDIPSADVVDVVRCKDCKHGQSYNMFGSRYCLKHNDVAVRDNDFCGYGERAEA